ncbi:hypothetical protein WS66_30055 [Burkholderia sp. LA-2-3-30-S1-D2]|nr:hypothetical protein WS66_30055 [Burkholderia sp. LA-2-3-30-S1-D2]
MVTENTTSSKPEARTMDHAANGLEMANMRLALRLEVITKVHLMICPAHEITDRSPARDPRS